MVRFAKRMNLDNLLTLYKEHPGVRAIAGLLTGTPPGRVILKGVVGSVDSVVAAALQQSDPAPGLFVMNDKEEAAYFLNDVQHLLGKSVPLFLPDSFKKPRHFDEVNNNNLLLRTETVNRLLHDNVKSGIIITYPEALFEKIVSPEELDRNIILLKKDERVDVEFVVDLLGENGFERTDFVYEPGTYAVRGGIVDIFSFGNELPYRVEMFGDEVESIRVFDPATQLSKQNISQVSIVPNIQTQFHHNQQVSLLESLPPSTRIWFRDMEYAMNVVSECVQLARQGAALLRSAKMKDEEHPLVQYEVDELFNNAGDLLQSASRFSLLDCGKNSKLADAELVDLGTEPQPIFNKNFELLIEDLKSNTAEGLHNFIFCASDRQVERFFQIFRDMGADLDYHPLALPLSKGFIDRQTGLACYTDHQIFERYHKYNIRKGYSKGQALTLKALQELRPGDFVTHIDHGVGVYSGLEKIEVNGQLQEAVRLVYRDNDLLYVNINSLHKIAKHSGKDGQAPRLNKLGSDAWERLKRKTKKKVKDIARDLIALYAKRKASTGFAFSPDTYMQSELEASFIYEDTPDQEKSTLDVKRDMESGSPMDRLVCGDVGFGKTEIAIRAAFKAVADSKQVAVLVPTTILAMQHNKTFGERLGDFPCRVDYLNRFKSAKQKTETLRDLEAGKIDIIIGTHALISKKVKFKNLGLMIIDEEQKFGVAAKEKLRNLKANVDTLTLTATPIPRTLKFSLMGARDLSIINTAPPNRQPITTELKSFDPETVRDAISYEIYRGGQVFFIHNRVKDIEQIAGMIRSLVPDIDIGVAHGQMDGPSLEDHMLKFVNRTYDVLICTNIVESGLDIPNANTIIINNAHWFGLSDLHQLRGRVGRSNKKAFCYLFAPPLHTLSSESRKRLKTIEEFAGLGSGFQISMRDMDIRGAGNLLGGEQSGFITEIGFEMYHKILDEAIRELKSTDFKELFADQLEEQQDFVSDCQIDTDLEMLIPDAYVNKVDERLSLYTRLDNVSGESELEAFTVEIADRFGPIPRQVDELFNGIRLRWLAVSLGFERIIFKNRKLRCYFLENQESAYFSSGLFSKMLQYVQTRHPHGCVMKQTPRHLFLLFGNVQDMGGARKILSEFCHALGVKTEAESGHKKSKMPGSR